MKWIRIDRPFPLPLYVKEALQKLDDAGHIAYIVGGSVRDFLLQKELKDYDIATSADPDELCRLFPDSVTVGKAFGVLKVPVKKPDGATTLLEIATFRQDLEYRDHRRPTGVLFSGPAEDARRRDFTINALFFDPKTSRILDVVGGTEDLRKRVIRAIGDPKIRFREDALRLLRAVRFTTRFGFTLEGATALAIQDRAKLIQKVSAERVRDELTLMLSGPDPSQSLRLLSELGLLGHVLPEVKALQGVPESPTAMVEGDVWKHTLKLIDVLVAQNPIRPPTLTWAALLHDIGKPQIYAASASSKNYNGHELEGAQMARAVAERVRMSREEIDTIGALVEDHLKFRQVFQMRESTLQRFVREPHFEQLLALHRADATVLDGNLIYYEFCATRFAELKRQPSADASKLIGGEDLIQLGFKPGPKFSEILRTVEDLALERKLTSKEQALEYVVKHFVG